MDKKEILARSRAENAAGDEREQSLVQKSRIFGFRCLWLSYFLIFFIFEITKQDLNGEFFLALISCWFLGHSTVLLTQGYYLKKKLYLVLGIVGCLLLVFATIFIRPILQIFVA